MKAKSSVRFPFTTALLGVSLLLGCSSGDGEIGETSGKPGGNGAATTGAGTTTGSGGANTGAGGATGGATTGTGGATTGTGGATTGTGGATTGTGGAGTGGSTTGTGGSGTGTGGTAGKGGSSGTTGTGGASGSTGTGGAAGTAGKAGAAGTGGTGGGSSPDAGPGVPPPPLDCGPQGWPVENWGPPKNRLNYVILGDGYTATTVETTLKTHIENMLKRRFEHESGQPYARYRKFVNICVMKAISQTDGIGNGPTAFDGGNGGDRLAKVNETKVRDYIAANVPKTFEIDLQAVVLNQNKWENTGGYPNMLWSGAHADAPGAALHEGGHSHHQLADEYCAKGTGTTCGANMCSGTGTEYQEVNSTGDCTTTGKKWDLWLGTTQKGLNVPDMGATGVQGVFIGSRYVDTGQYRPSGNSMMNSLFGTNVNTSFNSVSREQIIFTIWRAVVPVDATNPPAGPVSNPAALEVTVIDPAVIDVDWSVDGNVVAAKGGTKFDVAAAKLAPGMHTIAAKAYDNATEDLVRYRTATCQSSVTGRYCHATGWKNSTQTVSWTVTIP